MRSSHVMLVLSLCCLFVTMTVEGGPIFVGEPYPNIESSTIQCFYNATTDSFVALGYANTYTLEEGGTPFAITGNTLSVFRATIDGDGRASSGELSIQGITSGGSGSGTQELLLSGTLKDFFFRPIGSQGAPLFEFIYSLDGGSLTPDFNGQVDIQFYDPAFTDFPGDFSGSFFGSGSGWSGTHSPEPTTFAILLVGILGLVARRLLANRPSCKPSSGIKEL